MHNPLQHLQKLIMYSSFQMTAAFHTLYFVGLISQRFIQQSSLHRQLTWRLLVSFSLCAMLCETPPGGLSALTFAALSDLSFRTKLPWSVIFWLSCDASPPEVAGGALVAEATCAPGFQSLPDFDLYSALCCSNVFTAASMSLCTENNWMSVKFRCNIPHLITARFIIASDEPDSL